MATWAGAIVETRGHDELVSLLESHGVVPSGDEASEWLLIHCDVSFSSLGPPVQLAQSLSRELGGTVIAFFVQTTASVERIEQWENGELVRKLEYFGDDRTWIADEGSAQDWESVLFFDDEEGTGEGETWPSNLDDELSDEDVARYEQARAEGDASVVMDLLHGGSVWPMARLCEHFGVDPENPGARRAARKAVKPWIVVGGIAAFLVAMFVLGALTGE